MKATKLRRFAPYVGLLLCLGSFGVAVAQSKPQSKPSKGKSAPPPVPPSIRIVGGTVIDGTGAKRRRADVRIVGDAIVEMGAKLAPRQNETVLNAQGCIVAPGFIDAHSHADSGLLDLPEADSQIRQGITTAIVGQDGGSPLPLQKYFATLHARPVALNIASFVGHGAIRRAVIGEEKRAPTPQELRQMTQVVAQEMQAGAIGLSTGLEYIPGRYATTEEIIACAKAAATYGGVYISHVRNEDNTAMDAFQELIRVAEEARIPAQISHIKLGSKRVWGQAKRVLQLMDEANRRGLSITADVYPYLYWQSTIVVLIPTDEYDNRALWEKGLEDVGGAERVRLTTYTPNPDWQGRTLAEIAEMTGKDAVTLAMEITQKTHAFGSKEKEGVVVTAMHEDDLKTFIAAPKVMFCSDGFIRGSHPRGAGTYPRLLGRYVREEKVLSLEEAIRKMTSFPAQRMGLAGRGVLAPGKKADLVLFRPERIQDRATVEQPEAAPLGVVTVLVNGVPVLRDGKITGAHPGRPLRRAAIQPKKR